MNNFLNPKIMVGAALVGLVSAAGVYLYEQMYAEKRRSMLMKEVANLDKQVTSMRSELEALRDLQKESQIRRLKHKKRLEERRALKKKALSPAAGDAVDGAVQTYLSDSEYYTDYQSTVGTDTEIDDDEFYDVHTDEDSDDTITLSNGVTQTRLHYNRDSIKEDLPKTLNTNAT